jgi:hypothetical protein
MSATEQRLAAAVRAAADTVPPGSAPPLRLPAQPARRARLARRMWRGGQFQALAPLAAAASVTAVVLATLAITGGPGGDPAARPSPGARPSSGAQRSSPGPLQRSAATSAALATVPAYYVALTSSAGTQNAVVRTTATGGVLATVAPPKPYRTFTFVTAAADDRTFVLAAQRRWPSASGTQGLSANKQDPVKFFRLRLGPDAHPAQLAAVPIPQQPESASLTGIALSPDGRKLALSLRNAQIEVITLATGSARDWAWPGSARSTTEWIGNAKSAGQPLSWAADGRTLAFQLWTESGGVTEVRLLDTTSPGGSLRSARPSVAFTGHGKPKDGPLGNTLITPDGSKVVTVTGVDPAQSQVAEFSAGTGQLDGTLASMRSPDITAPWNVFWTSSSGGTVIVAASAVSDPASFVVGVLQGHRFTPLPGIGPSTNNVAW